MGATISYGPNLTRDASFTGELQDTPPRQSGNDLESPNALRPIDLEVAAIDREDSTEMLALCHAHQRGISEIHREVAILPHQLSHAKAVCLLQVRHQERIALQNLPQHIL